MTRHTPPATFHTRPLNMNGLTGHVYTLTARPNAVGDILLVSAEYVSVDCTDLLACLSRYGTVTMPTLPGLAAAAPFRIIGLRPTLDAFADYLAAFIRLRYRRKRFVLVGLSFGFVVLTRMLQRHPAITANVRFVMAVGGIMHNSDLLLGMQGRWSCRLHAFSQACLPWLGRMPAARPLLMSAGPVPTTRLDARTAVTVLSEILALDNCRTQIATTLWFSTVDSPGLQAARLEQHLAVGYQTVRSLPPITISQPLGALHSPIRLPIALARAFRGR